MEIQVADAYKVQIYNPNKCSLIHNYATALMPSLLNRVMSCYKETDLELTKKLITNFAKTELDNIHEVQFNHLYGPHNIEVRVILKIEEKERTKVFLNAHIDFQSCSIPQITNVCVVDLKTFEVLLNVNMYEHDNTGQWAMEYLYQIVEENDWEIVEYKPVLS